MKPYHNGNGGRKRGRNEMRTIKRSDTARTRRFNKGRTSKQQENGQVVDSDGNSEVSDASSVDEAEVEEDDTERKSKVYGALLTILKSEHSVASKSQKKKTKLDNLGNTSVVKEPIPMTEMDEQEEIENGLNLEKEETEESDNGEIEDSDDDENDPFDAHFNLFPENEVTKLSSGFDNKQIKYRSVKTKLSEDEFSIFSKPLINGDTIANLEAPTSKNLLNSYFIKKRLTLNNDLLNNSEKELSSLQKNLVDPMFQYNDILEEYSTYGKDEEEYRELYSLHVLNHIYKTRDKILKNNQRLLNGGDSEFLDQGFTRPKVLIVVPTRDAAYNVVETIIKNSGIEQVDKKGKFHDQFYEEPLPFSSKPKSFQHIFKGNTSDFFVLGIKFTRKAIKLFSNFYQSDIIVCSPLGMQMIVENTDKRKRQDDFLSSIEIMIFDQFHSMEFQNVSHITTLFDHVNKIPEQQREADFSRIRMWYINDQAKYFRQTMIFTKYQSPTANAIINAKCRNWNGRWKNGKIISPKSSSVGQLVMKIKQVFQRFDQIGGSSIEEPDYRFKFFTSVVIPSITKSTAYDDGILIYITEYPDYLRIRNYMKDKTTILFSEANEYSSQKQLTSNRFLFQNGKHKILLYTERLHHFRRYELKGIKSVLFYRPPTNPEFYSEVVKFIGKTAFLGNADLNISSVKTIYSKADALALERIVGTQRAAVLCHGQNEVYEFK